MLRRTHVAPFLRERGGELSVEWLRGGPALVEGLDRLCARLRELEGRTRREVAEALAEWPAKDARRLAGIAKTLLDAADFRPPPGAERAPEVRDALFRARGRRWPPVPGDRDRPYRDAAAALGTTPEEVERLLYADAPGALLLARAPRLDGAGLLRRYNLELARAVLLDATRVRLAAAGGWRDLFRAVKLARLMYRVSPAPGGYAVELTGPAAPWVARPARYGPRLARVLPALARAPGWHLEAEVLRGGHAARFRLDAGAAPFGGAPADEAYDSAWEQALAAEFAERMGPEERRGWTLLREATPVQSGEEVFLPDFTLRHADGREALVEVVGFWTPEYLEEKLRKVADAGLRNLVLVVYRGLAAGAAWEGTGAPVVWFTSRPRIGPVLEAAEALTRPVPSPVAGERRTG